LAWGAAQENFRTFHAQLENQMVGRQMIAEQDLREQIQEQGEMLSALTGIFWLGL
jgi:hypothetical protein